MMMTYYCVMIMKITHRKITHIAQAYSWDCGAACIAMLLSALNRPQSLFHLHSLLPASIWTIDLAYLLRHFNIPDFTYYTSYVGVNWTYKDKSFYQHLSSDQIRVHSLFAQAPEKEIRIRPVRVDMDDLLAFLESGEYCVVTLVDLNGLHCTTCRAYTRGVGKRWKTRILDRIKMWVACWIPWSPWSPDDTSLATPSRPNSPSLSHSNSVSSLNTGWLSSLFETAFQKLPDSEPESVRRIPDHIDLDASHRTFVNDEKKEFVGHYILLTGYDEESEQIVYKDPGVYYEQECRISVADLEAARSVNGTDYDLIVVKLSI